MTTPKHVQASMLAATRLTAMIAELQDEMTASRRQILPCDLEEILLAAKLVQYHTAHASYDLADRPHPERRNDKAPAHESAS